eukprot:jgi/Bigna1/146903/aug1.124_g21611
MHTEAWKWAESDFPDTEKEFIGLVSAPAHRGDGQNGGEWLGLGRRNEKLKAAMNWEPRVGERVQLYSEQLGIWTIAIRIKSDNPEYLHFVILYPGPKGRKLVHKDRRDILMPFMEGEYETSNAVYRVHNGSEAVVLHLNNSFPGVFPDKDFNYYFGHPPPPPSLSSLVASLVSSSSSSYGNNTTYEEGEEDNGERKTTSMNKKKKGKEEGGKDDENRPNEQEIIDGIKCSDGSSCGSDNGNDKLLTDDDDDDDDDDDNDDDNDDDVRGGATVIIVLNK